MRSSECVGSANRLAKLTIDIVGNQTRSHAVDDIIAPSWLARGDRRRTARGSMIFRETPLAGAFVIDLEPHVDERGFFARSFCEAEFGAQGLATSYPQANVSFNRQAHTLRGMHWQAAPHAEAKLVRCTAGAIYDVIVDLRRRSPTQLQWFAAELDAQNRTALYVPAGFAHGFLTLAHETEVSYLMSASYAPEAARGMRFDDRRVGIRWPAQPALVSPRDLAYPELTDDLLQD
jgi:dTDP-4-dehydrorhamnose 3,5-epimerase